MSRHLILAVAATALVLPRPGSAQPAPASAPAASAPSPIYRSAFDGYRAYREQPVQSWRAANELVGRLGGWQAYAREAQGGSPAGAASAASAAHPGGHSGAKTP